MIARTGTKFMTDRFYSSFWRPAGASVCMEVRAF
jgi:hypothetical protein